jgi:hypothetical protein
MFFSKLFSRHPRVVNLLINTFPLHLAQAALQPHHWLHLRCLVHQLQEPPLTLNILVLHAEL